MKHADERERARSLHRDGRLDEAQQAHEALLAGAPGDADLLGLLGAVALQLGDSAEAERLLKLSLDPAASGDDARLRLRNLNNLVALLSGAGRGAEARDLLAAGVPDWPADRPADAAERGAALSLTEALLGYGEPVAARRLLDRAFPERDGDAELLNLDGRLRIEEGDLIGAAEILSRAVTAAPGDWPALLALGWVQGQLRDREGALATAARLARGWPVLSLPAEPGQRAGLIALNAVPGEVRNLNGGLIDLHFATNYASEIVRSMAGEYRFHSVFADLEDGLSAELPAADVVLNNIVNAEALSVRGRLEQVQSVVSRLGLPVINPPHQVFRTTRQKNALLLKDVPNLVVPRIARYRVGAVSTAQIAADIAGRIGFPVILRKTTAHESTDSLVAREEDKVAVLARSSAELESELARRNWGEFYAIEYVDLRRSDGFYRKIRAVFVGDEIVLNVVGMNREWMVSGWRANPVGIAFYRENPQLLDECNAILNDPGGELGTPVMHTFAAIRERIPLDMFGIDCDVDSEGRVVFFEAAAAMIFHANYRAAPEDVRVPRAPLDRLDDAFHRLVDRKIAEGRRARP